MSQSIQYSTRQQRTVELTNLLEVISVELLEIYEAFVVLRGVLHALLAVKTSLLYLLSGCCSCLLLVKFSCFFAFLCCLLRLYDLQCDKVSATTFDDSFSKYKSYITYTLLRLYLQFQPSQFSSKSLRRTLRYPRHGVRSVNIALRGGEVVVTDDRVSGVPRVSPSGDDLWDVIGTIEA
jgi:hypothetical protein